MKTFLNLKKIRTLSTIFSIVSFLLPSVFFFFLFFLSNPVYAATGVPKIINFQGRLMNSSGVLLGDPAGTDYCFRFSIWDISTGGTANPNQIWPTGYATPTTMTIPVRSGVFDASIGGAGGDDLSTLPFTDDQAFINVEVATKVGASCTTGGDEVFETLDPRQQIVSSAYAINAGTVGGFTPAQSATGNQIPALTSGAIVLGHATTAGLTSVGANPLTIDAGTSGILNLNNNSSGNVLLGGGYGSTGITMTAAGNLSMDGILIRGTPVTADATADAVLSASSATQTPLVVQGAAAASVPLQEWQKSNGTVIASMTTTGLSLPSWLDGNWDYSFDQSTATVPSIWTMGGRYKFGLARNTTTELFLGANVYNSYSPSVYSPITAAGSLHSAAVVMSEYKSDGSALKIIGCPDSSSCTLQNWLDFTDTETVFNEDSADRDFRVETTSVSNAINLDAGANTLELNVPTTIAVADAATNTQTTGLTLTHTTSGTAAAYFGLNQDTYLENDAGTNSIASQMKTYWTSDDYGAGNSHKYGTMTFDTAYEGSVGNSYQRPLLSLQRNYIPRPYGRGGSQIVTVSGSYGAGLNRTGPIFEVIEPDGAGWDVTSPIMRVQGTMSNTTNIPLVDFSGTYQPPWNDAPPVTSSWALRFGSSLDLYDSTQYNAGYLSWGWNNNVSATRKGWIGLSALDSNGERQFIKGTATGTGVHVDIAGTATTADATSDVMIAATSATQTPLVVQGAAAASVPLQEWQTSAGTVAAAIQSGGLFQASNISETAQSGITFGSGFSANGSFAGNRIGDSSYLWMSNGRWWNSTVFGAVGSVGGIPASGMFQVDDSTYFYTFSASSNTATERFKIDTGGVYVGGGYGSTGVTISDAGAISTDGAVGIRGAAGTSSAGLYVPWASGDAAATAYFGSGDSSNNQIALYAEGNENYGAYIQNNAGDSQLPALYVSAINNGNIADFHSSTSSPVIRLTTQADASTGVYPTLSLWARTSTGGSGKEAGSVKARWYATTDASRTGETSLCAQDYGGERCTLAVVATGTAGEVQIGGGYGNTGVTISDAGAISANGSLTLTSTNTTEVTTASALSLAANSLTTGTGIYAASSSLTSGKLVDLQVSGTAADASQTALNILTTGANGNAGVTTYGIKVSNTHSTNTSTNVGLYATASGGATANYAGIFDAGQVLIGGTTATTGSLAKLNIISSMASNGSTTAIAGIHGEYTINPSAGGTQVGNRFVINNAPTSSANTVVNTIIRTIDNTSLANTVRGIEIVSNAGSNTAGTNTGIRTTGATFGIQALTNAAAGGVSLPAAIYGESTGTTQGDILRLYTGSMTSAPSIAQIYHDTSTFTGDSLLMDMAHSTGTFSGNFLDLKNASVLKFKVTSAGVTSMGLSGTASTTAVCSSLATNTAPTAGTAYEIRDCSGAPVVDYAEMFPVVADADYGDVMAMGTEVVEYYADDGYGNILYDAPKRKITKLVKADHAYQKNVIGIVSLNYGDFSSVGHDVIDKKDNPMPIALNGRVPVKVSPNSEAIEPGDYLTTSDDLGKVIKATGKGQVIGKALESWTPGSNTEKIMVFIEQGYYDGQDLNNPAGIMLTDTPSDSLQIFPSSLTQQTLEKLFVAGNQVQLAELNVSELSVGHLVAGLEITTPLLTASVINADTLNVSGDTTFPGLTLTSGAANFSGDVTFDSQVWFNLAPVFNKDTAGFAIIKEGDKSVHVSFEKPYAMTPVVTTAMTFEATDNIDEATADTLLGENITSIVLEKDITGFTILLNKKAPQNIRFSWIALGVKDASIFESLGGGLEFTSPAPEIIPTPVPVLETTPESNPSTDSTSSPQADSGQEISPQAEPAPESNPSTSSGPSVPEPTSPADFPTPDATSPTTPPTDITAPTN